MVTAKTGILSSASAGDGTTSTAAQRVIVDFKDALVDYRTASLEAVSLFCEPMQTETGGDIDITIAKPSMAMEKIDEGQTPAYQSNNLRNERISVDEWGIAVGVTRRMIEDSRFNEVELALNEARRAVDRHMTKHVMYALFGKYDATFGTGYSAADITTASEANLELFANVKNGAFFGANPATAAASSEGRLVEYGDYSTDDLNTLGGHYIATSSSVSGANDIAMVDLTTAMNLIAAKGGNANLICINPSHVKNLLDMADFTATVSANETSRAGDAGTAAQQLSGPNGNGLIGSLFGMNVLVNPYVPQGRFGVFDTSVKPMAYVERRGMTVEEANPGFGIVGSYMSMRYGLKIVRPESGVIVYGSA
jgi:hypothetical protein